MNLPDGSKPFYSESDRDENCAAENDVVDGIEEVAERVRVKSGGPEVTTISLDHAEHYELRTISFDNIFIIK